MSKNDAAPRIGAAFYACDGGGRRDRTDDLLLAKQALSQLSYAPDRTRTWRRRHRPVSLSENARHDAGDGGPGRI